jgi:hypothetical protein
MSSGLSTLAFILPEATFDMAWLARHLRRKYPAAVVRLRHQRVTMQWGKWKLTISRNDSDLAVEECREMAAHHRKDNDPNWRRVAKVVGRLELQADPDPEDKYYNQWLLVSEHLSGIPGVLAYDPMLGEWLGASARETS